MKNAQRISFRGQVREMAAATVEQLIGFATMQTIRAHDSEPYFFELVLGHEGRSSGNVVGLGHRVKEWSKKVIRAVVHAFNPAGRVPAKIYDGLIDYHGNQEARLPVGEVVHTRVAQLDGREAAQSIGYIYPAHAALKTAINQGERDICSMEVDVLLVEEGQRLIVEDVERATGVVLGHSTRQMPGFAGAVVRPLEEFGPAEGGGEPAEPPPAPAPDDGERGRQGDRGTGGQDIRRPVAPSLHRPVADAPAPRFTKAELISAIKDAGLTAEDLGWKAPASTVAAPPAEPSKPETPLDLTDPQVNPYLPA